MTQLLIADDHPLFREAMMSALQPHFPDSTMYQAYDLESMLTALQEHPSIELILLDLTMPGCAYFNGLITLREKYPKIPIAVISATEEVDVVALVMDLGANAYIPKSGSIAQVAEALSAVKEGEKWLPDSMDDEIQHADTSLIDILYRFRSLTGKQVEVLQHLHAGLMNRQIAEKMNVTEATVKAHISAVLRTLDIKTRTQAVLIMTKLQLV
ncbi:response regulator transcription factor [Alteromonas ponticola]|uniref:Response regulator transcription factor n=1 Tax=Alteromonas ponticola TaxID=2720613 RepID=A0ABX1R795_9ALTE|nr:response regulator transcription factor [Alteromonas ponticola]NMH61105.1 response regulator transcription factor [Alteromonas ponticola]